MSTLVVKTSGVCESDRDRLRGLPTKLSGELGAVAHPLVDTGEET